MPGIIDFARKGFVLAAFIGVLIPVLMLNVGANLEKSGRKWGQRLQVPVPALDALLLRQRWTLFTYISPFNHTTHFEVVLKDGRVVPLRDPAVQHASGWDSVRFHSEGKFWNNLYSNPPALRLYLAYLERLNRINPAEVGERAVFILYRNLLPRAEAARKGEFYGPEIRYDLQRY